MTSINKNLEWKPIQIILLLTLVQLFISLLTDGFALSFDEAMWHYIGRNWFRHGMTPYTGGVDNKSPLIFAVFGISDRLFGVNYWFPRVLGTVIQSIGIYYLFLIVKSKWSHSTAVLTALIYGLSLMWRSTDGKLVSLTETYSITFLIISIRVFTSSTKAYAPFVAGLWASLSLGFRISASFGIGAIFIFRFVNKDRQASMKFLGGLIFGVFLLMILAIFAGIHPSDFIQFAFIENFGKGSATDHSFLWRLENLSNGLFYSEMILFLPGVVAYLFIRKKWDFFVVWLLCEFIGLNIIGIYARPHFKNLLPSLSVMTAVSIIPLVEIFGLSPKKIAIAVCIIFFPKLLEPFVSFKKIFRAPADKSEQNCTPPYSSADDLAKKQLGLWIKANTDTTEKVLVAGYGAIVQAYSERIAPSIYFNVTQTQKAKQHFINDINKTKPGMILVPGFSSYTVEVSDDLRNFIDEFTNKNYSLTGCKYGYKIYRLNK
ncbi:MAG: hypothetical protein C5B52_11325 [Bacteroidetes bacterium]|nr:MAG: hypothetical protein C5B52_11325 [Bacteroidota bacterium]